VTTTEGVRGWVMLYCVRCSRGTSNRFFAGLS
jgi:hypothetical protein